MLVKFRDCIFQEAVGDSHVHGFPTYTHKYQIIFMFNILDFNRIKILDETKHTRHIIGARKTIQFNCLKMIKSFENEI